MPIHKAPAKLITFDCPGSTSVLAILMKPRKSRACFVFAHGAGAGMSHTFMEQVATKLYQLGIASFRYQFPYMEAGRKRPDTPAIAQAAVRAAVAEAKKHFRKVPIFAGGKSFGGRMTSQAQAVMPIKGVSGLAFIGFPLHPVGKPSIVRAKHLDEIGVPLLFIQGTRDKLAELPLLQSVLNNAGSATTACLIDEADHAFHVPKRTRREDEDVISEICVALAHWIDGLISQDR